MKNDHPAAAYLSEYQTLKKHVRALEHELDYLQTLATRATVTWGAKISRQKGARDTLADRAVRSADTVQLLEDTIEKLHESLEERLRLLDQLPDATEKLVLTYRYINGMNWPEICMKANYSERAVYRYHSSGLEHFWNIYQERS